MILLRAGYQENVFPPTVVVLDAFQVSAIQAQSNKRRFLLLSSDYGLFIAKAQVVPASETSFFWLSR